MSEINVDVILPGATTADVISPSFDGSANVFIPGADGPTGPTGPAGIQNSFKNIFVTGQSQLIPSGTETLQFIANSGIQILTDSSKNPYQSITINAVPLSGYFESENIVGFKANLTQGFDNYYISFPQILPYNPKSVVCTFQNTIDDMAYYFNLGASNVSGFYINFSDTLLNNGYFLNIQVKK